MSNDFISPSGVSEGIVKGDSTPGPQDVRDLFRRAGRDTVEFFTSVVTGLDSKTGEKTEKWRPARGAIFSNIMDINGYGNFINIYNQLRSNFDLHISASIPGYFEIQVIKGDIISKMNNVSSFLDIGCSEGSLIKSVSFLSRGKIKAVGIEPNQAMVAAFEASPFVDGAEILASLFGPRSLAGETGWESLAKIKEPQLRFANLSGKLFDVVHESETFQFMGNWRAAQLDASLEYLSQRGILLLEEKFNDQIEAYRSNEIIKDSIFKRKYFSDLQVIDKEMELKKDQIAMNEKQIGFIEMEELLRERFTYVGQYWQAGNFRGYAASKSFTMFEKFMGSMPLLKSVFNLDGRYITISETLRRKLKP